MVCIRAAEVFVFVVGLNVTSATTVVTPGPKCITSYNAVVRSVVAERVATGFVTSTRVLSQSFVRVIHNRFRYRCLSSLYAFRTSGGNSPPCQGQSLQVNLFNGPLSNEKLQICVLKKLHKPKNCLTWCTFASGGVAATTCSLSLPRRIPFSIQKPR